MWIYQQMQHCVHLLQRRRKYDDYGDVVESWADMGRVWAKIVSKTSPTKTLHYEITIRHPKVRIDRIQWDDKIYDVVGGVEEDARKTWRRFSIAPIRDS